jgi:hypothetical protein
MHNEVKKHLMDDIGMFKKEAAEDKKLIKKISAKKEYGKKSKDCECEENMKAVKVKKVAKVANPKAGKKLGSMRKFDKVVKEGFKGKLHVGSKTGPIAKKPKQILAIAYSEQRKANKRK